MTGGVSGPHHDLRQVKHDISPEWRGQAQVVVEIIQRGGYVLGHKKIHDPSTESDLAELPHGLQSLYDAVEFHGEVEKLLRSGRDRELFFQGSHGPSDGRPDLFFEAGGGNLRLLLHLHFRRDLRRGGGSSSPPPDGQSIHKLLDHLAPGSAHAFCDSSTALSRPKLESPS